MYHRPPDAFLYSSYKILTKHSDGVKTLSGIATGFVIVIGTPVPWIVTNRHVVDLDYNQSTNKYKDFHLTEMEIIGRLPDDTTYSFSIDPATSFYYHSDENNDVVMIEPIITKPTAQFFGILT